MPLEQKEILEYLGYKPEEIGSLDDFKSNFEKAFVRTSNINDESPLVQPIIGRILGGQENELRKIAKAFEIEVDFDSEDFKANKKVTDKTKFLISKFQEKKDAAIAELKKQASQGSDEKVKEFQTKYEKTKQEKADLENLLNLTKTEFDSYKEQSANEVKTVKLDIYKEKEINRIMPELKKDRSEYEMKGYLADIKEKYILDLTDDPKDPFIVKGKDGKRIPSEKVAGTFKSYYEVLVEEAVKGKLYELNKDGGTPKQNSPLYTTQHQQTQQFPSVPERRIAPPML